MAKIQWDGREGGTRRAVAFAGGETKSGQRKDGTERGSVSEFEGF